MSNISTISRDQAITLCTRPEDQFFDRKSASSKGKTVQKIAVAFGNSEGGEIAFGLKDDSENSDPQERLDLFADPEEANDILQSIYQVNPALTFRYTFHHVEGESGVLLRVFIDKSQHMHATADGTVYRRLGAGSVSARITPFQ